MKSVISFLFVVFLLLGCAPEPSKNKPNQKPNVIFILADDLGYNDLSCMGSKFYESPNIDRIAQEGMVFTNGYAACQVCSPSRASIMTGKNPARHGITDWLGAKVGEDWRKAKRYTKLLPPEYEPHLAYEDVTMAEAFKSNGYKTFFAGKWHLGNEGSYPQDHGFDVNQGGYERGGPYSGGFFSPFSNPQMDDHPDELGMSLPEKLAKETNLFIEGSKGEPFFAFLSFYAVHAPIQTTKENWVKYRAKAHSQGVADQGFEMERRLPIRKQQDNPVYAGLIEHMDDAVGQVLDKLEELGLDDNTIVVFTSDNGGVSSGDNFSTNLNPLRGGKGYQWEGGIKVPFIINVPWMKLNGKQNATRVTGADFYPTLLDLTGQYMKPDQHEDGLSFKNVLLGYDLDSRPLVWHYPHYGNQGGDPSSIIIKDDMKLIYYHETASSELYDLSKDISEQDDIAEKEEELVIDLRAELMSQLKSMGAKFPSQDPMYSQDSFDLKYEYFSTTLKQRLEKQRAEMLSDTWKPNEDWWGSRSVED